MLTVEEYERLHARPLEEEDMHLTEVNVECPYCEGTGLQDDDCPLCLGTGIGQYGDPDTSRCHHCRGLGSVVAPPCGECDGNKVLSLEVTPAEKEILGDSIISI